MIDGSMSQSSRAKAQRLSLAIVPEFHDCAAGGGLLGCFHARTAFASGARFRLAATSKSGTAVARDSSHLV